AILSFAATHPEPQVPSVNPIDVIKSENEFDDGCSVDSGTTIITDSDIIDRANARQDQIQLNSAMNSMPSEPLNETTSDNFNDADHNEEILPDDASVKSECGSECECAVDSENLRKVKSEPTEQDHAEMP